MTKKLTLYTFQPLFVWQNISELGYYHPFFICELDDFLKEEKDKSWGFYHSYEWLKDEMKNKQIKKIYNDSNLIWAWYQWAGVKKKSPDKRFKSVYSYFEEPYVMLELNIETDRVLLSDYDAWHFILNYWYLSKERESEKFSKTYDYYGNKPLIDINGDEKIRETWKKCFDMKLSREILKIKKTQQQIQATFYEILYEDVKKVHFFENGKCVNVQKIRCLL